MHNEAPGYGTMRHEALPAGVLNSTPLTEDFSISILLKELREEIAPIIQFILSILSGQASSQQTGAESKLRQSLIRAVTGQRSSPDSRFANKTKMFFRAKNKRKITGL